MLLYNDNFITIFKYMICIQQPIHIWTSFFYKTIDDNFFHYV